MLKGVMFMSVLQIFIVENELAEIVRMLASKRGLGACLMGPRFYTPFDPLKELHVFLRDSDADFMLIPEADIRSEPFLADDVRPRYQGWIQVRPGLMTSRKNIPVLEMTSLYAEHHKELPVRPSYWLRALKKQLVASGLLRFGVTMRGFDGTSNSHVHKDVGYSEAALNLYSSGTLWMQYKTNTSYFEPANDV
jgi:hypothetical protein